MAAEPKRTRRRYSEAEKHAALTALILAGGNSVEVGEAIGIDPALLRNWRTKDSELYERLRFDLAPQVAERMAAQAEALALKMAMAESKLVDKVMDTMDDLKPAEAAAALRNLSTSKALQVDKLSSPLRGRPTVIHQAADAGQALAEMGRRLGFSIDSTAHEIPQDQEALEPPN